MIFDLIERNDCLMIELTLAKMQADESMVQFEAQDKVSFSRLLMLLRKTEDAPVEGLAGYLVTEDPTYLPDNAEIKVLVRQIGRDKLLRMMLTLLLSSSESTPES